MSGGSAFSGNKSKLPPMADVAAMLDDGAPLTEIADAFGCSQSTLLRRLNQAGYDTATGGLTRSLQPAARHDSSLPVQPFDRQPWADDALCLQVGDPETWFPEKGGSTRAAKRVCLSCDVRGECLQYALDHEERYGIWGGLSERERRQIIRRRKGVAEKPLPVADIVASYGRGGQTLQSLAVIHKVDAYRIKEILVDAGVHVRSRGGRPARVRTPATEQEQAS